MKINNQYNKSIDQTNDISRQETIHKINDENINIANSINQYIKRIENLSTDWVVLEHLTGERFFPSFKIFDENLVYEWIVDLNFLPNFLIPYLNIQILYKSPEDLLQRDFDTPIFDDGNITFKTVYIIQSEEFASKIPKIRLIATISVRQEKTPLNIEDIEARLLLTLQNPNDYI